MQTEGLIDQESWLMLKNRLGLICRCTYQLPIKGPATGVLRTEFSSWSYDVSLFNSLIWKVFLQFHEVNLIRSSRPTFNSMYSSVQKNESKVFYNAEISDFFNAACSLV